MRSLCIVVVLSLCFIPQFSAAQGGAQFTQTPYTAPKVVFDFYFDEPAKINTALFWIRSLMNPLMDAPYNQAPEFMNIVVVIHGTEIVTVVKKNYALYKNAVDRMRYYHSLGVSFRVCSLAAEDYGYKQGDFDDFVELVPSAMAELAYWQMQGYALIRPVVYEKKHRIEDIR